MRILSYLNVSNIDDIESDSGYIFNYTLAREFVKRGHSFHIILPLKLERTQTRFLNDMVSYINMGTTKYESRYHFEWMDVLHVIEKYHPDIVLLNQVELTATFRVLLHSTGHEAVKIFTYCHYPATHIDADTKDVILDYTLNDYCLGENIIYNILTSINVSDVFANQLPRCKHSSTVLGSYVTAHSTCLSLLLPQDRKRGMKISLSLFLHIIE